MGLQGVVEVLPDIKALFCKPTVNKIKHEQEKKVWEVSKLDQEVVLI